MSATITQIVTMVNYVPIVSASARKIIRQSGEDAFDVRIFHM